MIPKNKAPFINKDLFGGQGEVRVWDLLGRRTLPPFEAALACELAPGGSVGLHQQETADELLIVLEGEGRATVHGEEHTLEPGATLALAVGQLMSLENGSTTAPLRYLIIKARRA